MSQPAPAAIEKSPYNEIISKHHLNVKFHPFIKVEGISLKEFRGQRIEILANAQSMPVLLAAQSSTDELAAVPVGAP